MYFIPFGNTGMVCVYNNLHCSLRKLSGNGGNILSHILSILKARSRFGKGVNYIRKRLNQINEK
jgi:hypothetical protein